MKPTRNVHELCSIAANELRRVGFEFRNVSLKTEACYYQWPGYDDVIRIATHGRGGKRAPQFGLNTIAANLTFRPDNPEHGEVMKISDCALRIRIATAIGQYFMRAKRSP